jgi:transposase
MDDATLSSLPDDPEMLRQMIVTLTQQRDEWKHRHDEWKHRHDEWKHRHDEFQIKFLRAEVELLRLKKWYYGRKADSFTSSRDIDQMLLAFGEALDARPVNQEDLTGVIPPQATPATQQGSGESSESPESVEVKSHRRVKRSRRNLAAFDDLPVSRREHDLKEEEKPCPCCGEMRQRIGEETSWQIELIPARFERIEHVRIKYACKHCEGNALNPQIELADKPRSPIEKGLAGPGLLSYIVTSKYSDYLPLYRLEAIFERNGFEIDRSTLGVWCRDVAETLLPLYKLMKERLLLSHLIATDDTTMPMLSPGKGKTTTARMWVYVGDEINPYNLFDFTLSRNRDGPNEFLSGFARKLLADGYGGYNEIVLSNDITRCGCWAHVRRKFIDAEKTAPAIAEEAVKFIGQLYTIESEAKEKSNEERLCLRQARSQAILETLKDRLFTWKAQLLPKHPMADAVNYALNQWEALSVFVSDGAVPIDNNISEREIKRIVLNRKNSLFVGNPRGGETAAILASLTSTCRRHNIDPQHYFTQLLTNLPDTPINQLPSLLPDEWKKHHAMPRV